MGTINTLTKIAASAAIAGSLGLGGLSLATGVAAAAPADHSGTGHHSSEQHARPAAPGNVQSAPGADDTKIAHLIPGFTPKPVPTTTPGNGLGATYGWDPGSNEPAWAPCGAPGCHEVIDE
ncbi:hypothetical protein [Mycolicibacterium sp. P1-5]|uniref:hypothetical protein n=1 Tax=Mycolicibacterium sp. P1-5 TaxID=2024617 RepID=UPI0011F05641|nr:hypothetical protein [Mycolicibacterium sp. P1-5]KAA0110649.1 hypothetical protein CIW47_06445 [Mycolicibacterium sp. P1-5]